MGKQGWFKDKTRGREKTAAYFHPFNVHLFDVQNEEERHSTPWNNQPPNEKSFGYPLGPPRRKLRPTSKKLTALV